LCARHMAQFVGAMQQWIEMARLEPLVTTKSSGRGKGRSGGSVVSARSANGRAPARRGAEQVAAIRTWARAHGYTVAEKGRIPTEIEDAYNRRGAAV
jgi:Lsr2